MREFELTIGNDFLKNGLKKGDIVLNSPSLTECFNIKAGIMRLESYTSYLHQPVEVTIDINYFPFPQLFGTERYLFLATTDSLAEVDILWEVDIDTGNLSKIVTWPWYNSLKNSRWEIADFGTFIRLSNGTVNVVRNISTNSWDIYTPSILDVVPICRTSTNFNGNDHVNRKRM